MGHLTVTTIHLFICGLAGTKEWLSGDIKQEDEMYAYSDASNIVTFMVSGEWEDGGTSIRMGVRMSALFDCKLHLHMGVVCGVSGLQYLVCTCM